MGATTPKAVLADVQIFEELTSIINYFPPGVSWGIS